MIQPYLLHDLHVAADVNALQRVERFLIGGLQQEGMPTIIL
jgi:hypothetical protein